MRIPRIFHPGGLTPGDTVTLDARAARHLVQVLRLQAGAALTLFNGQGGEYSARLASAGRRAAAAQVMAHEPVERESPLTIALGQCMARGPRMDTIVQKAVELGAAAIMPLTSRRCEVRLDTGREAARLQHWEGVIAGACEQCGRNRLPVVHAPQDLAPWLEAQGAAGDGPLRLVLHPAASGRLQELGHAVKRVVLLCGPEGGLTDEEVALAEGHGFRAVRLGPRTLRAETAPLAAMAALQALWGDL